MRTSSVVLAVALAFTFGMLAAAVRAHAEYVHRKNAVVTKPGGPWKTADVRRAEQVMNGCFALAAAGLVGCTIASITVGTVTRTPRRRGFDVIQ